MDWFKKLFSGAKKAETEAELARMLKEQTGDPAFLHRTNWITAYGKKNFKAALDEVNRALQIVPNNSYYLALRAMTHYSMKNYAEARSDLKDALQSNPAQQEALDIKEAMKAEAVQCRDRARELSKKKGFRQALDELSRAVDIEPDNPLNFFFRGLTYAQIENYDAAINDVTRTLQLDPRYPEGEEVLQSLKNMASSREQKATEISPSSSGVHFCFVCSGNRSLIASFYQVFRSGAPNVLVGHYKVDTQAIQSKRSEAETRGFFFRGTRFMGKKEERIEKLEDVLSQMEVGPSQELHILLVSAQGEMYVRMQLLYNEMLSQAVNQGILPFPMFVTESIEAKQFLLDSFTKVS